MDPGTKSPIKGGPLEGGLVYLCCHVLRGGNTAAKVGMEQVFVETAGNRTAVLG